MSLAIRPTSGVKIYASATLPATLDGAGYEAITTADYKLVGGADNAGRLGTSVGTGNFTPLDGAQQFYRTVRTAGSVSMSPADLPGDAGQSVLKAAFDLAPGAAGEKIALKVEDTGGYITYCTASVTEFSREYGGAEDLQTREISMQPDPDSFVETAP